MLILVSCKNGNGDYDAYGIFETTEVIVSAQGTGTLLRFNVTEGQSIDPSVILGHIDTTQLHLKKVQLQANISGLKTRRTNIPVQIASLKEQVAAQKRERERFENLVKQNAANQKQLDDVNTQLAVLEKQLAAQMETFTSSNSNLTEENTAIEVQIAQIEDQIKNSVITSPIRGTILSKYAEQGEYAMPGKALFKVADIGTMYLRAYISAAQLTGIKVGQAVKVYSDMGEYDRRQYPGTVTRIADKAEFTPKTIQTRDERANLVYAVKIEVKNDGYIKKGMYGEVKFTGQ